MNKLEFLPKVHRIEKGIYQIGLWSVTRYQFGWRLEKIAGQDKGLVLHYATLARAKEFIHYREKRYFRESCEPLRAYLEA